MQGRIYYLVVFNQQLFIFERVRDKHTSDESPIILSLTLNTDEIDNITMIP
jgi:hypothetical protein